MKKRREDFTKKIEAMKDFPQSPQFLSIEKLVSEYSLRSAKEKAAM